MFGTNILSYCNHCKDCATDTWMLNLSTIHYISLKAILRACIYNYHLVDTSAVGLLVLEGIIRPVVGVSAAPTWFIKYINIWIISCGQIGIQMKWNSSLSIETGVPVRAASRLTAQLRSEKWFNIGVNSVYGPDTLNLKNTFY
jgi:hypothetical protein